MSKYRPSDAHRERDRKKPGRKLFLKLKVNRIPPGVTRHELIDRLLEGIEDRDYWLPSGWDVDLWWRNKEAEEWREESYPVAMSESAENGRGFDIAVARYLESQRYRRAT